MMGFANALNPVHRAATPLSHPFDDERGKGAMLGGLLIGGAVVIGLGGQEIDPCCRILPTHFRRSKIRREKPVPRRLALGRFANGDE
jgi:hypothetical protein